MQRKEGILFQQITDIHSRSNICADEPRLATRNHGTLLFLRCGKVAGSGAGSEEAGLMRLNHLTSLCHDSGGSAGLNPDRSLNIRPFNQSSVPPSPTQRQQSTETRKLRNGPRSRDTVARQLQ
ncbi:hypothetical protein SKAU_G00335340 [Synaphobranchus kaupii]|uniref:Uncharacterized protein n=1 Tax=Synaphobranchus kaupii TaxID=118154 RepID=A0A9Q1ELZ1_SYNKA|nr:hypothetical protein SKAU_G00335340 [Synaphobranchus kaupii]